MKRTLTSFLFLVTTTACISTQNFKTPDAAETIFNEYCHNGKQIKKMGIDFEIIEPKCQKGTNVFECARQIEKSQHIPDEKIWKIYYEQMTGSKITTMSDKSSLIESAQEEGLHSTGDIRFVQFSSGEFVLTNACLLNWTCLFSFSTPFREKSMFDSYTISNHSGEKSTDDFYSYLSGNYDRTHQGKKQEVKKTKSKLKLEETSLEISAITISRSPSVLGQKYSISINLDHFCQKAIPLVSYQVQ
jgi:hypothetical protein